MPNPILTGSVLAAGLRNTFADAYAAKYKGIKERLSKVMALGLPSDKLTELYGAFKSAPYPVRWHRGNSISSKAIEDFGWQTTNYDWGRRIEWHENDRADDQTKSLFDRAKELGKHFATLPERIFFQILLGSTDADLLPAVPNAADGSALYAASRFGVTAGNIISGSGVATAAAVRGDFFNAIEVFRQFKDTESQPLWDEDILQAEFVVFYNVANDQIFREAFIQSRTLQSVGTAGTDLAATAVTNIVMESGLKVVLVPTQRITDNDAFVFATGVDQKAIYQQVRAPLRESVATMENSDSVRDTKIEYIQWDCREGYGVFLPYQTVKINN